MTVYVDNVRIPNRARLAGNGIAYPFDHPED